MTPVLAQTEPRRFAVGRQIRRTQKQIRFRKVLVAAPKSDLVVNGVDASATCLHFVRAQHFHHLRPDDSLVKRKRAMRSLSVPLEAFPVAFEGKRNSFHHAHRREQTPPIQQSGLARRETRLLYGKELSVMRYESMNHCVPQMPKPF